MVHAFDPFDVPERDALDAESILCCDEIKSRTLVVHHVETEPLIGSHWVCRACGYSTVEAKA